MSTTGQSALAIVRHSDARGTGRAVWAQIALAIGSVVPILAMPIIVGGIQDHWGYSASYAGYLSSIDLAGLFVGAVATSACARRIDWKRYVTTAIVVACIMNVLCVWFHTFGALSGLRFGAGLASGAAYSSSLALLSRAPDTARAFSWLIFSQVVANALVLAVFPTIDSAWGPAGMFVATAAVLAVTLVVIPSLPGRLPREQPASSPVEPILEPRTGTAVTLSALCLSAVAFVYVAIGSYWAYAERMGITFGIRATVVHYLLTAGVLLSSLGCVAAFRLSRIVGQSRPLLAALILLSATLLVHSAYPNPVMYVVTLGVLQVCWNFIDIFQLGTLAIVDPSGRSAALVPAAQGVALAAGPAAGGFALSVGKDYSAVLLVAGGAATLATLCYAIVHAWHLRATPELSVGF